MGNIYVFYADQYNADEMMQKGFSMYRKAMRLAAQQHRWDNLMIAFCNIISSRPDYARKMNVYSDVRYFLSIRNIDRSTPLYEPIRTIANGMTLMERHDYRRAIATFGNAYAKLADASTPEQSLRFQSIPMCHIAECYAKLGETQKALDCMHGIEQRAAALNLVDLMPEIYSRIETLYRQTGNKTEEQKYRMKYLETKDSLMHGMEVAGVKDMHFLHELNILNSQLVESTYQRERQRMLLIGGGLATISILAFLIVVYRKNRQLDARNKVLYQHMHQMLQEPTPEPSAIPTTTSATSAPSTPKKGAATMSDEQKTDLMQRLNRLLADTDILCAADLTEQKLAKQLGSNSAYLSKVVNDLCNCNFNTYINTLRVKEACKRFDDIDAYGQLSIEGIGISVGFNSRSTFSTVFKRVTGLTPSEYQRQSRKNA